MYAAQVFVRKDASGATKIFTQYLSKACPEQWDQQASWEAQWGEEVEKVSEAAKPTAQPRACA